MANILLFCCALLDAFHMGFRYFMTSRPPKFFSGHMIDGGVVLLSRFPIKRRNQMVFSCGKGADALASKVRPAGVSCSFSLIKFSRNLIHVQ